MTHPSSTVASAELSIQSADWIAQRLFEVSEEVYEMQAVENPALLPSQSFFDLSSSLLALEHYRPQDPLYKQRKQPVHLSEGSNLLKGAQSVALYSICIVQGLLGLK